MKSMVFFLMIFSASAIYSMDGAVSGKIGEINNQTGEILVNTGNNQYQVDMGDKLYVRIEGKAVIMKATFPMLTVVKCRLAAENKSALKDIKKGMVVYKYKPGIEKIEIKNEISSDTGTDPGNRRRILQTEIIRSASFNNTVWKISCPGSNPELYYVTLKPGGKLGYNYKAADNFQFDSTDTWHTENDTLVIVWTDGYSTEKYKMVSGSGIYSGMKVSKSYEAAKESTIEKLR